MPFVHEHATSLMRRHHADVKPSDRTARRRIAPVVTPA
jgi:hypothetical protein